ncbi:metal dependent phosphohydrolase [Ectopseudomonas mendocina]|uniref:HD-GYP domain-containing protein n=2 Tax=Ectopseudomonas mendocina TaxID=300 RepID=A0A379IR78_ECTME|nr:MULTISPECIES: HD-GYP domain-containing protein [Pseudomonas]ALN21542.1 hydrolase [Pseudomonas mendocina S5.2]KES01643.1 hydrolase [Pseudomonas mendocina]MDF2077270.1 HD-GYP domain-containing protein [Pseudomonas mendocina]TRO11185.1 HD-GYP domain-containing protein [Pseudomonas mendocina]TRO17689.1 HD-GYP domain-containing protein [Pseudomonas mendocina]
MLKRIAVADLRIGMYVQEFCGSWMDHPFWKSKFLLNSPQDLQRIRASSIGELWIDVSKGLDVEAGAVVSTEAEAQKEVEATLMAAVQPRSTALSASMDAELERAAKLCARSKQAVLSMFGDARMGKALNFEQAESLVEEISDSVMRHPNALISLARLKHADEYTYMHSVAVCALMIALARQLGLGEGAVREAGLAGLLHDVGKMAIDQDVLNKPGKLSDAEFSAVRRHPEAGGKILLAGKQVSALVLDVCLHHHEKVDGSGYPHGLQGEQISLFARMGAVCDVYDAITSNRPYKQGWDPAESIRKMAEWKGHFDEEVFQAFVKTVGIYPVGALVRLESGRLAVVLEQNAKSLLVPKVKAFFLAKSKVQIPPVLIDLSKANAQDRIVGRESAAAWGFEHLDELWSGMPQPRARR